MAAERDRPTLDLELLTQLASGVAPEIGVDWFSRLVEHVARALGTKGAWVTEWLAEERRLRALAFWHDGRLVDGYEYAVAGTPCEPVVDRGCLVHIPERVVELYPDDPDLPALGAVSYLGTPLRGPDGAVIGHLAAIHDAPLPQRREVAAVFELFAGRAAAELGRLRLERQLRDREQRLTQLFDSAMDAILELDEQLVVLAANPAAARTFGCEPDALVGMPLRRGLAQQSHDTVLRLCRELAAATQEPRSSWLPTGTTAVRADGTTFPAEATLSAFERAGRPRYSLILRNVEDRVAAERRLRRLADESAWLREEVERLAGFDEIVGTSPALRDVLADVDRVARSDTTVLLTGETGTGKELIARAIHRRSGRAGRPLVAVNCGAIAAGVQESEFFGHVKGAFTGAHADRPGRFRLADGGTIFLDEVGELPLELQAGLLRVLQEGEIQPVGGTAMLAVDVRVIAATHRDLQAMVAAGTFREDLYYRLAVFPIRLPALRERGDDVVLLAEALLQSLARRHGLPTPSLTEAARLRLRGYSWPGNIRELQNVLERALLISADRRTLELSRALPDGDDAAGDGAGARGDAAAAGGDGVLTAAQLRALERRNLQRALERTGWKVSGEGGAAELLGMNPNTLASRIRTLGLRRPRDRS